MSDALDESGCIGASGFARRLDALRKAVGPPLLFGVRLSASVCLALYVAFWLQLDNAYWAGTTAALVCQPHLGASLRKAWFRSAGTVVGGVAIVLLSAWFPQNRTGFLVGLALWGGGCALAATLLRNFAAYAAVLAGLTAAIIASDELGAVGGSNGEAFTLAITRVSEIWIGIVCAGIVLAGTDFGGAPRRLAVLFEALSADIARRFTSTLALTRSALSDMPVRREFIRQVIALEPMMDDAIGESSRLRYHSAVLQAAVDGLFAALAAWRTVAARLARLPDEAARQEAHTVLHHIPEELRSALLQGEPTLWMTDPVGMHRVCDAAVRGLITLRAGAPSLRLLADQTASVLAGFSRVLDGLALLVADPAHPRLRHRRARLYVPDWLPAFVNAGRAFVIIGAFEVFWIMTAWPDGPTAIIWTAFTVMLFAPRADEAYASAVSFTVGTGLAVACAAVFRFAVLPNVETFAGFAVVMGLYLVPIGALMAQPRQAVMFAAMAGSFVPVLAPTNQMSYDPAQFYNAALAIVVGCGAAVLSFQLLPPLSPALRTRRLLRLTLCDLRRLATDPVPCPRADWRGRIGSRLVGLPDQAEPLQRAQLLVALSVGTEIIHLRRIAPQLGILPELDFALDALARGHSTATIVRLADLDRRLVSRNDVGPQTSLALHERGRILAVCDALVEHRAYFDAGAPT